MQRRGGGNPGPDDLDAAGVLDLDPGRRWALIPDHPTGRTPAGGHAQKAAVERLRKASVFLFPTSR
jgi:hypothetical protein